jgi:Eukaryotic Mediator 12 subunit domain
MFFNPKLYHQYWYLLQDVLVINTHVPPKTTPEARSLMKYYWKEISARNELYCGSSREQKSSANHTDEDKTASFNQFIAIGDSSNNEVDEEERLISFLDDVGLTIDSGVGLQVDGTNNNEWKDVRGWYAASVCSKIFGSCEKLEDTVMLSKKIETLCTWATTTERSGDWRAYFIASLLSHYIDGTADTEAVKIEGESHTPDNTLDKQQRKLTVQESLMRFLDHSDVHENEKLSDEGLQMDVDHGKCVLLKDGVVLKYVLLTSCWMSLLSSRIISDKKLNWLLFRHFDSTVDLLLPQVLTSLNRTR